MARSYPMTGTSGILKPLAMNIQFNFHGSTYKAGLSKRGENKLEVLMSDKSLEKKFGASLPFYIENKSVSFNNPNKSHSDLYALNSSISKAISEQCVDMFG